MAIKALSIWQPHAGYIISDNKRYETRPGTFRQHGHRGLLAIHASKQWSDAEIRLAELLNRMFPEIPLIENPPLGAMLGICRMLSASRTESIRQGISRHERAVGGWEDGRWALELEVLEVFETPIKINGQQGLFDWEFPEDVLKKRIAIVGSRDYKDLAAVRRYISTLPKDTTIITGGARGVDKAAEEAAHDYGLNVVVINVNTRGLPEGGLDRTNVFAQRAMIRNGEIVQMSGSLVAFHDGVSRGTANSIERAQKAGIPVIINPNVEVKEAAAKQLTLTGFTNHYDELSVISHSKVAHGLIETKKTETPFEWSAPWLAQNGMVWVWDGWKEGKRQFKLVAKDSKEAEVQARFLKGFFYGGNTLELREWLDEQLGEQRIPGYVADIGDMSSNYMLRDGAKLEDIPLEKLVLTQETYLVPVWRRYCDNFSLKDADGNYAYGMRFSDSDRVYVADGTHRTLAARSRKHNTMRLEVNDFPETFAQACQAISLEEDEEDNLQFYAEVLLEALKILEQSKEPELEPEPITA